MSVELILNFIDFLIPVFNFDDDTSQSILRIRNEGLNKIENAYLNLKCSIYEKMIRLQGSYFQKFIIPFQKSKDYLEVLVVETYENIIQEDKYLPCSVFYRYQSGKNADYSPNYIKNFISALANKMLSSMPIK